MNRERLQHVIPCGHTARKGEREEMKAKTITLVAVMTAVMCILGPVSIPVGVIPVSLTVFTCFLAASVLGMKLGTLAYIIYLLIGLIGVPVLSGYSGGPAKVFGPTGGYLVGFIFLTAISGWFVDHFEKKVWLQALGMVLGLIVVYLFGTVWLAILAHMTAKAAFMAGVAPFVVFDLIKIAAAIAIGRQVRVRLKNYLPVSSHAA